MFEDRIERDGSVDKNIRKQRFRKHISDKIYNLYGKRSKVQ